MNATNTQQSTACRSMVLYLFSDILTLQRGNDSVCYLVWVGVAGWTSVFQISFPVVLREIHWNPYTRTSITDTVTELAYVLRFV